MTGRITKVKYVVIDWIDPSGANGWVDEEKAKKSHPLRCSTAGEIIQRNSRKVVVAATRCYDNGTVGDITSIPVSCIQRIRRVK